MLSAGIHNQVNVEGYFCRVTLVDMIIKASLITLFMADLDRSG
jgi:hypothetical protein